MKIKSKITALLTAVLMLLMQVPFTAFAAGTDIRAELLSPDTLPNGRVEVNYYKQFYFDYSKFDNGFQWYSWDIVEGNLPSGLELGAQHSTWQPVITGTPTKAGSYTFTIEGGRMDYINGENVPVIAARKTYTMTILPAYPLKISNYALYHGKENEEYSLTMEEEHYRTVEWSMELADGGALPDGLTINAESGKLTWESPIAGKYDLKFTATRDGESVSKVLRLIIESEGGCKHTNSEKTVRKAATCKENGLADYWYCDDCEYYFLNESCTRVVSEEFLAKCYTTAFHSDENKDGKCDTCEKVMPIFTKVTDEADITSCGMYLVVSKIGDKYYTLKTPEQNDMDSIEAIEITQNSDGTFSYPEANTEVMILKTEPAAECYELDAGLPRYSLGTTIDGMPYSLSGGDYSGNVYLYSYENSKYGYRISLPEGGTPAIASVYADYWSNGDAGKSSCGVFSAFEGKKDGVCEQFFSFRTKESYENDGIYTGNGCWYYDEKSLTTHSIELYKLTYAGNANGQSYTLSDAQSMVTINNEFTVIDSVGGKSLSTVGGISEAVKPSYVESVISEQTDIVGDVSVRAYADISLKNEESTVNEGGETTVSSLVYEVVPKLEIKEENTGKSVVKTIGDENLDGSEIKLTLCVGNMTPEQIIHHKSDGTKEYFYNEQHKNSGSLKPGQKTFSFDYSYKAGNFVTFSVTSFSEIEILAVAKSENGNEISYTDGALKINVEKSGVYSLILANYNQKQLTAVKTLTPELVKGENPITELDGFTLSNGSKIFLWENLTTLTPLCDAYVVNAD